MKRFSNSHLRTGPFTFKNWTISLMFKKTINALGKCLPPSSWLSSMSIEDEHTMELCTLVLEANQAMKGDREYINVKVTYDFKEVISLIELMMGSFSVNL